MDIKRFPEKMGDLPIDFSNPKRTLISGLFQETAKVGERHQSAPLACHPACSLMCGKAESHGDGCTAPSLDEHERKKRRQHRCG